MASIGKIEEYKPDGESIAAYLEQVELFFAANNIEDDKKVTVFLSVLGASTYTLLRDLVAPTKPSEKSFAQLKELLKKHYEPTRIVIAERFYFHRRSQQSGESIAQYMAELRKLANHCEFAGYLEEALRDRFVCGIRSEGIQRSLLAEENLTLTRAIELAQGMEAAEKNAQSFKGTEVTIQKIRQSATPRGAGAKQPPADLDNPCYRCGKKNHTPANCRFKEVVCHHCQKKGHLAKVCRQRLAQQSTDKKHVRKQQGRGANWVQTDPNVSEEDSDTDLPLYQVSSKASHPITVDLEVNKTKLTMEIDTGAAVSVISEQTRRKMFPDVPLSKSTLLLKSYTGEVMPVLGEMKVEVKYRSQTVTLTLTIVEGSGPSLFGRDWLGQLQLDWKTIGLAMLSEQSTQIAVLKKK